MRVQRSVYYPATESTVPPASIDTYRHRDYSPDFDTTPQWTAPAEDAEGYIEWTGNGHAMEWSPDDEDDECSGYMSEEWFATHPDNPANRGGDRD